MRLLFLTVMPSPYQRQLFDALNALDGLDLSVLYFTAGAHDREWQYPDLHEFEKVLPGRTLSSIGPSAHWNPTVIKEVDAAKPDLVIVSDYSAPTAQFAMRRLASRGIPFMFWGELPGFSTRGLIGSTIRRQLQAPLNGAEGIVGIGSVAVKAYKALFPHKPVYNIPYFCDLDTFIRAKSIPATNKKTIDILFSGQLIDRKGLDLLIQAFNRIAPEHPDLRLLVLGSGPNRQKYESMADDRVKGRVAFLGHKEPDELPNLFASADIFCLPSRHDGWGVVVNEALGAGLPIVASTATGAAHDLITEGVNGFITQTDDVASLEVALRQLTENKLLRQSMSVASQNAAASWGVDEGARRWSETADQVLAL